MKTVQISELSGAALDWAVATANGDCPQWDSEWEVFYAANGDDMDYSTNWAQGGTIIEREGIGIWTSESGDHDGEWCARKIDTYITYSPTPLIAAMRCYVASKLGNEMEIPDELAV